MRWSIINQNISRFINGFCKFIETGNNNISIDSFIKNIRFKLAIMIPAFRLKLSQTLFSQLQFVRNLCASFFLSLHRIHASKNVVGIEPIVVDLCPFPRLASNKLSR
jgi:hypothetical protein